MAVLRLVILFFMATWLGCGSAQAERQVALVIGNSAYRTVPRLINPANDAALVGGMFKKAGFDNVDIRLDMNAAEMRRALREFANRTRDAEVAVIYYAGHGIELDGTNYLIPTDATLETDGDVLDETVALDRALFAVEPAKQLRLVILDACRDNPFAKTMKRASTSRSIGRGLAKVEPSSPNTMIAFAAKAGSTAADGEAKNSPFAMALVDHLPKPGLDLRKAFGFVRDDVLKKTGYKQEPYVYGSLGGEDVPLVAAKPTPPTGAQADPQAAVRRDYELALQLATRDGWEAFLSQYTDGFYANLAKGQLKKIAADEARQTATEKARLAEQEKARLAAEGARQVEMAKAVATARAAEAARVVADRAKQIEQEKTAAAERARIASEKAAADKVEAEKAAADKLAAEKTAATKAGEKIASLTHLPDPATPTVVTKSVQLELRRVGCLKGAPDGEWNTSSQRSMSLFNRYAGTNFDAKLASLDALDAIKAKPSRVCPLVCDPGHRTDGDSCVKITCRTGFELDENNSCKRIEKKRPPLAKLDEKASEIQPKTQTGDGSCGRMKDPLRCSCALKHGGYIYPDTRSSSGYSWRSNGSSDFFMCLHSAGRR